MRHMPENRLHQPANSTGILGLVESCQSCCLELLSMNISRCVSTQFVLSSINLSDCTIFVNLFVFVTKGNWNKNVQKAVKVNDCFHLPSKI